MGKWALFRMFGMPYVGTDRMCSELTVKPLMVTGNVAEKRRICQSVGRNEINLSSACW